MADTKISDLTAVTTPALTDLLPVVQTPGVGPKKATVAQIATLLGGANFTATRVRFEDDCFFGNATDFHAGNTTQVGSGTGFGLSSGGGTAIGNHPGLIQVSAGTATTSKCGLFGGEFYLGGGIFTFETVFALQQLSNGTNTYVVRAGVMDTYDSGVNDGVFLRYTDSANSGKWLGVCRAGGTESTVDTGVTATSINASSLSASMIRLGFTINAARTSVQFYVNGSAAGSAVTSNIPSSSTLLGLNAASMQCSAGTSFFRDLLIDYYSLQIDFTSSR